MATYDAVTLTEAKDFLALEGTAEDETIVRLITGTTLEVERKLATQFVQRSVVEYHEGGGKRIYLQRIPIVSVASIVDPAGNTVLATDYVVRQQRWLEHFGHFNSAQTTAGQITDWTVTYTCGWFASTAAVAADVKQEVLRAIAALRESPAAGVSSVGVGDLSISYGGAGSGPTSPAIEEAAANLYAYRGVLL